MVERWLFDFIHGKWSTENSSFGEETASVPTNKWWIWEKLLWLKLNDHILDYSRPTDNDETERDFSVEQQEAMAEQVARVLCASYLVVVERLLFDLIHGKWSTEDSNFGEETTSTKPTQQKSSV